MALYNVYHKSTEINLNEPYALFIGVDQRTNEITCFEKKSACFVHLPKTIYDKRYYREELGKDSIPFWIRLLTKNREKYQVNQYLHCCQLIDQQLSQLRSRQFDTRIPREITLSHETTCPLCLEDYPIGTVMNLFHNSKQPHLACGGCYQLWFQKGYDQCPICRTGCPT